MNRALTLRKESLAALTDDELDRVAGGPGTHILCYTGLTDCGICDPHLAMAARS